MSAGEMAAIIEVMELPPRESLSNHVRIESRYGTMEAFFFLPTETSARAAMTRPRGDNERLISAPSFKRAPVAPVEFALSEPAKSTKLILDTFSVSIDVSES